MDNANDLVVRDLGAALGNIRSVESSAAPFVIVPDGYSVADLEKTLITPIRKRGSVTMNDAASFIDYFKMHGDGDCSHIFGQVTPPKFVAVFNGNSAFVPGWGDHRMSYACPLSTEWNEWLAASGQPRDQIKFAEFIETHVMDIVAAEGTDEPTGADMLQISTSFQAQKKVNFASGQRLDNGQVQFTFQEVIESQAGEKGQIRVPASFWVGIPVFEGGSPYKVECKLRYRIKDGALSMWFELVQPGKRLEAAFLDLWKEIADGTEKTIWRGTPG